MAYSFKNSKGTTYYLHSKTTKSASGKERTLFYFSKQQGGTQTDLPSGYTVAEMKTGLPVLKKA